VTPWQKIWPFYAQKRFLTKKEKPEDGVKV
jgi:hypothetical protein